MSPLGITAGVLVLVFAGILSRRVSTTAAVVGGLVCVYLAGVVPFDEAFAGLSNPAPLTLACLYVIAAGVDRTGGLIRPTRSVLNQRTGFAGMLVATSTLSSVMANSPIVAMLVGPVTRWAERTGRPPSRVLIPLSFATILGGTVTVMGTSTNLVASGILAESGLDPVGIFEPARLGLPVAAVGLVLLVLLAPRLLPDRGAVDPDAPDRAYTVVFEVVGRSVLDGSTVSEGQMRNLPGVFLISLERDGELIAPVSPDQRLRGGDLLTFAGQVARVVDLEQTPGLELAEGRHLSMLGSPKHAWFEAVIGSGSPLVGRTLAASDFRSRYQAAVVALHRSGERVAGRLGDVRLQAGDALLLLADARFRERWKDRSDFLLIRGRNEAPPSSRLAGVKALTILIGVVAVAGSGRVDLFDAALAGAVATVLSGVLTPRQARDAVDLNVVVLIAASLGLGAAVQASGLASLLATSLTDWFGRWGTIGVVVGLLVATVVLTELVTNTAAVALMLPLGLDLANGVGLDSRSLALGVMVVASASFLTPIGYQTNTMVYGPGRYHFFDYARLGLPLTVTTVVITTVMLTVQ